MQTAKKIFLGFILLLLAGCSVHLPVKFMATGQAYQTSTPLPNIVHKLQNYSQIEPFWNLEQIRIQREYSGSTLDAAMGKVCYIGSIHIHQDPDQVVICLDGTTGNEIWSSLANGPLIVSKGSVYTTTNRPSVGIKKYNLETGEIVWEKNLGATSILYFYFHDNQIQVSMYPDIFWKLDPNKKQLQWVKGKSIIASYPDLTYIKDKGIQAYQTDTNKLVWEYTPYHHQGVFYAPLFTSDKVFLHGEEGLGTVYALDRLTGKLLWQTPNIISNLAYSPNKKNLYALRENGSLIALNENNGAETLVAQFSSVPFFTYDDGKDLTFQVAYDPDQHILFAALGDSHQLFAFKEK